MPADQTLCVSAVPLWTVAAATSAYFLHSPAFGKLGKMHGMGLTCESDTFLERHNCQLKRTCPRWTKSI